MKRAASEEKGAHAQGGGKEEEEGLEELELTTASGHAVKVRQESLSQGRCIVEATSGTASFTTAAGAALPVEEEALCEAAEHVAELISEPPSKAHLMTGAGKKVRIPREKLASAAEALATGSFSQGSSAAPDEDHASASRPPSKAGRAEGQTRAHSSQGS